MKGPIFRSSPKSNKRLNTRSLRRRADFYLDKAGLKRARLSIHALRATSSTLLMESGATLIEIQNHLNHTSPETTMRYLARLDKITEKTSEKIPVRM